MRKATIEEGKICPNCRKQENQVKIGYNRSGTQRVGARNVVQDIHLILKNMNILMKPKNLL